MLRDLQTASTIVWLILSAVVLCILAAPFVLSDDAIAGLTPVCRSKASGGPPCVLCGMTTAFLLISQGNFDAARHANPASLLLYSALFLNELFALLFLRFTFRGGSLCRC